VIVRAVAEALRIVTGGFFVLAASSKALLFDREARHLWVPAAVTHSERRLLLAGIILGEGLMAFVVALAPFNHYLLTFLLCATLAAFSWYGSRAIHHNGSCGCFSPLTWSESSSVTRLYLRNIGLATLGSFGLLGSTSSAGLLTPEGIVLAVFVPWLSIVAAWTFQRILQSFDLGRKALRHLRIFLRGTRAIT
jgi:hypothetical protein